MPNLWQLATTPILKKSMISFVHVDFLAKSLSNFASLSWKLHNRYCHKSHVPLFVEMPELRFGHQTFDSILLYLCIAVAFVQKFHLEVLKYV